METSISLNYLAIILCGLSAMLLGMAWYGFFSKPWAHYSGLSHLGNAEIRKGARTAYAVSIISNLLLAYILAHFVQYMMADAVIEAMQAASWLWLGFVATTLAIHYSFAKKSYKLWLIDAGYQLLNMLIMAAILTVVR